jgi:hypothetical protein
VKKFLLDNTIPDDAKWRANEGVLAAAAGQSFVLAHLLWPFALARTIKPPRSLGCFTNRT